MLVHYQFFCAIFDAAPRLPPIDFCLFDLFWSRSSNSACSSFRALRRVVAFAFSDFSDKPGEFEGHVNTHIHTNTHEQRFIMSDVEVSVIFARVFVREPRDRSGTFSIARDVCHSVRAFEYRNSTIALFGFGVIEVMSSSFGLLELLEIIPKKKAVATASTLCC